MSNSNSSPAAAPTNQDGAAAGIAGAGGGALLDLSMVASHALTRRDVEDLRQLLEDSTMAIGLSLDDFPADNHLRDNILLQNATAVGRLITITKDRPF